jgi:hypothetical protein
VAIFLTETCCFFRIFARKLLVFVGDIINDYMTGRYFRTTYTRLERTYLLYYETPSAFRALCRITAQITIYFSLSSIMAWFVGIRHPPCHGGNGSLASFCALLWISTVVGIGHAFSTAVSSCLHFLLRIVYAETKHFHSDFYMGRTDSFTG